MSIDGLEETENDPYVHGEDVEVTGAEDVKNGAGDRSSTENKDFSRMGVLRSEAEGGRVLVMNFVNVLIHGTPMKESMGCARRECKWAGHG